MLRDAAKSVIIALGVWIIVAIGALLVGELHCDVGKVFGLIPTLDCVADVRLPWR